MKRIIGWFVGNPVAANLLMMILVVGGLISVFQLRQEEMPAIDLGIIEVTVTYLGAAPEEVENGVSLRIEEALEGIQGVDRITSTSSEGRSRVVVEIEEGADRVQVLNEVKSQVDAIITFPGGDRTAHHLAADPAQRRHGNRHLRECRRTHPEGTGP